MSVSKDMLPHCTGCGLVLTCSGSGNDHEGRDTLIAKLVAAVEASFRCDCKPRTCRHEEHSLLEHVRMLIREARESGIEVKG